MSTASNNDKPSGAMALLDKYALLNNGIEEARRKSSSAKLELENIRQQIQTLGDKRLDMKQQIHEAKLTIPTLNAQLQEATKQSDELERRRATSLADRDSALREVEAARQYAEEERITFLKNCREFRITCKRLRLSASSLAPIEETTTSYHHHPIGCYSYLNESETSEDEEYRTIEFDDVCSDKKNDDASATSTLSPSIARRNEEPNIQALDTIGDRWNSLMVSKRPYTNNPRSKQHVRKRSKKVVDLALSEAESKYTEALQERNAAKQRLDEVKSHRESKARQSDDRAKKLEQQRAQLDRVRHDVDKMEKEIAILNQTANKAKQQSLAKEQNVCRKWQNHSHQQVLATGSYDRYSAAAVDNEHTPLIGSRVHRLITPSPHSSESGDFRTTGQSGPSLQHRTPLYSAPVNNPYKKGTSGKNDSWPISYSSGGYNDECHRSKSKEKTNSLERQHPHRAGRIRVDRQFSMAIEISGENETAHQANTMQTEETIIVNYHQPTRTIASNARSAELLEDNDDDEDDQLLSYVVFENCSMRNN